MNIAYYSHYFTPEISAPSTRIYELSQRWLEMGHSVQVVTCFPNYPTGTLYPGYSSRLYMHEFLHGIDVHRHWTYIRPPKGFFKRTLGYASYVPTALLFSNRYIKPPDVIIGTSPPLFPPIAAAWTALRRGLPFIMEVRDLWPALIGELGVLRNPRVIRWLERLELMLYRHATKIVTVTEAFRTNLIERGVPPDKIATIRNGADVDFWQPRERPADLLQRLGLNGCFIALYIGTHGLSQALTRILDSAQHLERYPDIQILFLGGGTEKQRLVRQAQEMGLKNVQFLDPVDKEMAKQFYALADVCLVPLRNIPLFDKFIPSKIFEMMAMARPIVASVRGEAAAILNQSGSAFVTEPEDSSGMAQAILQLYQGQNRARLMGEQGRKFVVDHYSRRTLATAYSNVIQEAIATHRRQ